MTRVCKPSCGHGELPITLRDFVRVRYPVGCSRPPSHSAAFTTGRQTSTSRRAHRRVRHRSTRHDARPGCRRPATLRGSQSRRCLPLGGSTETGGCRRFTQRELLRSRRMSLAAADYGRGDASRQRRRGWIVFILARVSAEADHQRRRSRAEAGVLPEQSHQAPWRHGGQPVERQHVPLQARHAQGERA